MLYRIIRSGKFEFFYSLALVGYRATGKTTVGKILAHRLGWNFLDMDELLVKRFGMTISDWVSLYGWNSFRDEEMRLLKDLAVEKQVVLATGGGVVERAENRELLKKNFFVVWLKCSSEEILNRLKKDEKSFKYRPSLTELGLFNEIVHVLLVREPLYREVAHVSVDVNGKNPEMVSEEIIKAFSF
ncbi:MAG: shikimate kinase [Thermodesulforhabdaceae bacterium]